MEHKQMDEIFHFWCGSRVDGPSTCTNHQHGLADRECLLPSQLRTSGTAVRVKSLRGRPGRIVLAN